MSENLGIKIHKTGNIIKIGIIKLAIIFLSFRFSAFII